MSCLAADIDLEKLRWLRDLLAKEGRMAAKFDPGGDGSDGTEGGAGRGQQTRPAGYGPVSGVFRAPGGSVS
jgi:hypothetical protein